VPRPAKQIRPRQERIAKMDKEVLDVDGAAAVLGLSTGKVYQLARAGEIPGRKYGKQWRFNRTALIQDVDAGAKEENVRKLLKTARVAKKR